MPRRPGVSGTLYLPGVTKEKLNKKVNKAIREVKKLTVANEQHYHDTNHTYNVALNSNPLTNIAVGDGPGSRTGNNINVTGIELDGYVTWTGSAGSVQTIHMAIVQDKQQVQGSSPAYSSIFDTEVVGTEAGLIKRRRNVEHKKRFSVLWEKTIKVGNLGGMSQRQYFQFSKKYKAAKSVTYANTGAGDIQRNGIYFVYLSDTSGSPNIGGEYATRLHFDP